MFLTSKVKTSLTRWFVRKALPLLQCNENGDFPGYGFGGSIASEIRGGEMNRILSRDRGTMVWASSSITQLFHKLAASPTSEASITPSTWISVLNFSEREGETLGVIYALYGHIDSFGIIRGGVGRRELRADRSSSMQTNA